MALPPLYYLRNFRLALATLQERYDGLLSSEESGFVRRFALLSQAAQCLLTRLVMRKGLLFRRATLQYDDVPRTTEALGELALPGWVDPNPLLSADELAGVLNAEELRLALGIVRVRRGVRTRPGVQVSQLALPLSLPPTLQRSLPEWNALLAGCVVHLCVHTLIHNLELLFFGNDRQSWSEFVLTDLGVKRYERIEIGDDARAFHSREEIEHFYRLYECKTRLEAGDAAIRLYELAAMPDGINSWLRARFAQLNIRIGEVLEEEGNVPLALRCYRDCRTVEGRVRAVRLQLRSGDFEAARRDAEEALSLGCNESQRDALERALARARRRLGGAPARRFVHEKTEQFELSLVKADDRQRVEQAVAAQLRQPDSQVFYVENSLLSSLFGLLCWEAVFAPVSGAFFHPFQAAPADLYTDEFRERRTTHFQGKLALLDTGEHEETIWRLYRAKAGIFNRFVRWDRLRAPLLRLALHCIPAAHMKLCFERLLNDLSENRTGLPDLVQFWPTERRYRLIEVKGPGDRLQDNQRRWMRFFASHAIPAVVCHVRWH